MGASVSKSTTEIIAEAIINVVSKAESTSSSSTTSVINIFDSYIEGGNITQKVLSFQKNFSSFQFDNSIVNELMGEIQQIANSENVPLSAAVSENEVNIKNILNVAFENDFKSSCSQTVNAEINIVRSVLVDAEINNYVRAVQTCIQDFLVRNTTVQQLSAEIDQKAKAKATLFNVGMGGVIFLVVLIIAAVMFSGGKKGGGFELSSEVAQMFDWVK